MTPSLFQTRIFDFIEHDTRSLIIEAVAGSGKTTTLVEILKRIPTSASVLFLAFNKLIATELAARLPATVQCSTFHSHCFKTLKRALPHRRVEVDNRNIKCYDIFFSLPMTGPDKRRYQKFVLKLVSHAKNCGMGVLVPDTNESWHELIRHFGMMGEDDSHDDSYTVGLAQQVLAQSNANTQLVDFDDMLYFCLLLDVPFDKFQYVLLDESQDTNGVQRWILHRLAGPKTRFIFVGDTHQSIYGFRGATPDAMVRLKDEFSCAELPLSVTYRCASSIVKLAQAIVPHILPRDGAPVGKVEHLSYYKPEDFNSPTKAILCRNTFPLVSFAYALIQRKVPCKVLGRETGFALNGLIDKCCPADSVVPLDDMLKELDSYEIRESRKCLDRNNELGAELVQDRCACIRVLADSLESNRRTVQGLKMVIDDLFTDKNTAVLTLCTVHKSKGLEWDEVYILDKDKYMPSKFAKRPWEITQEKNLLYVAQTRAKTNLFFIQSAQWRTPKTDKIQALIAND